ncbi:hypothetical protein HAX54_034430, partial [Datura stramonium]|nr:hypothetical protein [Datura stramonium]
ESWKVACARPGRYDSWYNSSWQTTDLGRESLVGSGVSGLEGTVHGTTHCGEQRVMACTHRKGKRNWKKW